MSEKTEPIDVKKDLGNSIKSNEIMEALREVYDPELGMNVVELGLIRKIQLDEDVCNVEMILTTPFCPYAPALMREVENVAQIAAGVPTEVEMGVEMWDPSMMEEGLAEEWGLF
jgi:metal-sulfur cluster biosynthetic enzyme